MIEQALRRAARPILNRFPRARALLARPVAPPEPAPPLLQRITAIETELTETQRQLRECQALAERRRCDLVDWRYHGTCYEWRFRALAEDRWGPPQFEASAPRPLTEELRLAFSMNGLIPIVDGITDRRQPSNYPLIYTDAELDSCLERWRSGEVGNYGDTDIWLREALAAYPLAGKTVAVIGSLTPWYEAAVILHGGRPTTIDYNRIIAKSPRLAAMTVDELTESRRTFDAVLNISSIEHDGLGSYGDPIDPNGDLKAMKNLKSLLPVGALMIFAVPIGRDVVVFNAHRAYGRIRLPLLLEGWETVATFGLDDGMIDRPGGPQPIFVLRNL
jgi:hypothetical protein